jgi:hypothetical protein
MKTDSTAINKLQIVYINLSEQLREELELKIENLYSQNRFAKYRVIDILNYQNAENADFLCSFLNNKKTSKYVLSVKLLKGIKTWYNMYYDDRLSVIEKFSICYQKSKPSDEPDDFPGMSIVFCKFLVNELLRTLADSRWETLINQVY